MHRKEFHERLLDLREKNDLMQKEISKELGISQQEYSNYERGTREVPLHVLLKLSKLYGISTDYLLDMPPRLPGSTDLAKPFVDEISYTSLFAEMDALSEHRRRDLLKFLSYLLYQERISTEKDERKSTGTIEKRANKKADK